MSGASVLGRMCRSDEPPVARAEGPSGHDELARRGARGSSPRVSRANAGTNAMPMATMLITMPGPNTAVKSSADRIAGKPCTASTSRMSASSIQPPT